MRVFLRLAPLYGILAGWVRADWPRLWSTGARARVQGEQLSDQDEMRQSSELTRNRSRITLTL